MAISTAIDLDDCDPLVDEQAAAEFLDCARGTLAKWRCYGAGPEYVKVGRLVRYQQSSLKRFVRTRTRISTRGGRDARPAT